MGSSRQANSQMMLSSQFSRPTDSCRLLSLLVSSNTQPTALLLLWSWTTSVYATTIQLAPKPSCAHSPMPAIRSRLTGPAQSSSANIFDMIGNVMRYASPCPSTYPASLHAFVRPALSTQSPRVFITPSSTECADLSSSPTTLPPQFPPVSTKKLAKFSVALATMLLHQFAREQY